MENCIRLDCSDFIKILDEHFENNNEVKLRVTGNSMSPFLVDKRDYVILSRCNRKPTKGDILLYRRAQDKFILHRVKKYDGKNLWFVGDAQNYVEGPLSEDCIIAQCKKAIRKGKTIDESSFIWRVFSKVWIYIIPCRKTIIRFVSVFKNSH